jgi:hypothetical protein
MKCVILVAREIIFTYLDETVICARNVEKPSLKK